MIDVKIINSVLEALTSTFKAAAKSEVRLQKPNLIHEISESYEIVTTIGFNGSLQGNVIYTVPSKTAITIVNNMMAGMMEITSVDEMAVSAIGELGNMISGAIAVSLEKVGYPINITPPSVVRGFEMKISVEGNILKFSGNISGADEIDVYVVIKK